MVEDDVERRVHVLDRRLAGRYRPVPEQDLRRGIVLDGERHHAAEVVGWVGELGYNPGARRVRPAGERAGEVLDRVLVVRGDRLTVRIEPAGAVGVQLALADGEELQELARVVLVRLDVLRRVGLRVVDHVEELAHGRAERDLVHDVAEVREREVRQNLLVEADAAHRLQLGARDHQDLRQCECDPLPELVGRGHRVLEELPLQRLHGVVLAVADVRGRQRVVGAALARIGIDVGEGAVAAHRLRELLFERERRPFLHHFRDPAFGRPEARLLEEAHRVARTGGLGGWHGARRRRRRGCRRRGARCGRSARCGRGRRCRRAARRCGGAAASRCSVSAASRCGVSAAAAAETAGEAACDGEREQEFVDATCGVHAKLLSFDERHSSAMERGCRRINGGRCKTPPRLAPEPGTTCPIGSTVLPGIAPGSIMRAPTCGRLALLAGTSFSSCPLYPDDPRQWVSVVLGMSGSTRRFGARNLHAGCKVAVRLRPIVVGAVCRCCASMPLS